jgi:hypothetical protein
MPKTKKRSFGSIEMTEIPRNKRLGRKTLKKSRVPIYRMRVKKSVCRRKKQYDCYKTCKYAAGRERQFCRKKRNLKIY